VVREMESYAEEHRIPIIGPAVAQSGYSRWVRRLAIPRSGWRARRDQRRK
jgi:hypothetical protein